MNPLERVAAWGDDISPTLEAEFRGDASGQFDLEAFIERHGLKVRRSGEWNGGKKWELEQCPFNPDHTGGSAVITRSSNGVLGFKCHHNSCTALGWTDLREKLEPGYRKPHSADHRTSSAAAGPNELLNAASIAGHSYLEDTNSSREDEGSEAPPFPELAWRGIFAEYRQAMHGATEASDVAHFATLLTAASANLGRRVSIFAGDEIFSNVYVLFFGPTGDKKTTSSRGIFRNGLLAEDVQVLRNVGSIEGMADALQGHATDVTVFLFFWEEISMALAQGRRKSSAVLEFLTETFDCPPQFRILYRRNPVNLVGPTPSILAGTTPEWFWKNAEAEDFYGGFGNRFIYLTGKKKAPIPCPRLPDPARISSIRSKIIALASLPRTTAVLSPRAQLAFEEFYIDWENEERTGILAAAVKRIHVYVRKLGMVYAACEGTLPEITFDQIIASIAVARYAAACTRLLVHARSTRARPEGELEERFLAWVRKNPGARKRHMQQTLSKYAGSCEVFNRIILNLIRADLLELRDRKVYPSW